MARGSNGRGRVPALLVARVSTVHRVKPRLVTPRVESPNLNLLVVVRAVRRIELSIPPTVPVYASRFATRTPASSEIRASSVIAPLLRRSVPVVRSPLVGPRARTSDRWLCPPPWGLTSLVGQVLRRGRGARPSRPSLLSLLRLPPVRFLNCACRGPLGVPRT